MRMRLNLFVTITTCISLLSLVMLIFFSVIFIHRAGLPYNDQGRYFTLHNDTPIIYHQQSLLIYGLSSIISLLVFLTAAALLIKVAVKLRK